MGGDVPVRPNRLRDVRNTFGDPMHTLPLLAAYVLDEASAVDVRRAVNYINMEGARYRLQMFRAQGVLKQRRRHVDMTKYTNEVAYSFVPEEPLTAYIIDVLAALDRAAPHWRMVFERQAKQPRARGTSRRTRRTPKGWR
jgi:hypothetical protein